MNEENINAVYTVTLADDTVIGNLRLNGNNFISQDPIDPSIFTDNLKEVKIASANGSMTFENMDLIHCTKYGEEYWFALRELSLAEIREKKTRSDIDYIAMMTDVEL